MGFSIKVAPGVRVRASSRGVRTSLGPRVARVHVGAGRTGVSTGVGPVGYYTSLGPTRGRTNSSAVSRPRSAGGPRPAQAAKAAEAERLERIFEQLTSIHRERFPDAERLVAPPPPAPPARELRRHHRARATRGIGLFDWSKRRMARAAADAVTERELVAMRASLDEQRLVQQGQLDALWRDLQACERRAVMECLVAAFADSEAPAAPLGVEDRQVSLVVLVPAPDVVPDRRASVTASGNLSLKKLTKTEAAMIYRQVVFGYVLVTLREAFAVVPSLQSARIVAIRRAAFGLGDPDVLLAASCQRQSLASSQDERFDAEDAGRRCLDDVNLNLKGVAKSIQPLSLSQEPDLKGLLEHIDMG